MSRIEQATSFALDATDIYWTFSQTPYDHGIYGCPKKGCISPTKLANRPYGASELAVDAQNFYWVEASSVMKCSKAACDTTAETLAIGSASTWEPVQLAVDATTVYWTASTMGVGALMACDIAGCAAPTTLGEGSSVNESLQGTGIALDANAVYWSDDYAVYRCLKTGCPSSPYAFGLPPSFHVFVDGPRAFSVGTFQGAVEGCDWSHCAYPYSLSPTLPRVDTFTIDGTNAYWPQDEVIMTCPEGGCGQIPTPITVLSSRATELKSDQACLYAQLYDYPSPLVKIAKP